MTLTLSQGMTVLQSAVSCLGSVVNKVTKNYALVRDCFKKFESKSMLYSFIPCSILI